MTTRSVCIFSRVQGLARAVATQLPEIQIINIECEKTATHGRQYPGTILPLIRGILAIFGSVANSLEADNQIIKIGL